MSKKEENEFTKTYHFSDISIAKHKADQEGYERGKQLAEELQERSEKRRAEWKKERNQERGKKAAETRKQVSETRNQFKSDLLELFSKLNQMKIHIDDPNLIGFSESYKIVESMDKLYWEMYSLMIGFEYVFDRHKLVKKPMNEWDSNKIVFSKDIFKD